MTDRRDEIDPSAGSYLPQPSEVVPLHPGLGQLGDHPELILVVTRAVDEVIKSNNVNRKRDADLVEDVEQAAVAAALTTYQRMVVSVHQASHAADQARLLRGPLVVATAKVLAESVTDTAAEVHNVEDAAADHVAWVAANAASEVAALVSFDDEAAAATAAALVVKAVSDAAAVNMTARADAAASVTQAAAADAAEVA